MRRVSGAPAVDRDPRKPLARLSHAAEAAPFDRAAVEALLAEATAWPLAKVGGGLPIEISHFPVESAALASRRRFAVGEAAKWAAVVALGVFAIGAGLVTLNDWRTAPEMTAQAPQAAPATQAPGLYVLRPEPVIEGGEAPSMVASVRPAPSSRPDRTVRRSAQPPRAYAQGEAAAPLPPILIQREAEVEAPVLAMASAPRMPSTLVVRRRAGADVLGSASAPRRAADDSDGAGLRSVEPERMAMSVDVRAADRP